jgi:hypothetical protein
MKKLRTMVIQASHLSGPIPAEYAGMNLLTKVALDNNELTGAAPDQRTSCTRFAPAGCWGQHAVASLQLQVRQLMNVHARWPELAAAMPQRAEQLFYCGHTSALCCCWATLLPCRDTAV